MMYHETTTKLFFDLTAVMEMFLYSIRNTFSNFGGTVFQQTVGIPMGANHCVYVANLYLLQYERIFFRQIVTAIHDRNPDKRHLAAQLLATFRFVGRFIDDEICLTHNPSLFTQFLTQAHVEHGLSGIYPVHLGFKVTSCPSKDICNFLNLRISIVPHSLGHKVITGIYRKDEVYFRGKVNLIRMPFYHSNIPSRYKLNVLHSQVVEYTRLCNTAQTAAKAIAELMHLFARHGYPMRPLWRRLSRSLHRVPFLYGNAPGSIYRLACKYY